MKCRGCKSCQIQDCHALHFDEPAGSADGSEEEDNGLLGETFLIDVAHHDVVGGIAQIDNHGGNVGIGGSGLREKGLHILQHTVGLAADVVLVHHLSLVVNTGGTGDKDMAAVGMVDIGAALETHTVFAGAV